jgi:hypothetical protein
LLKTHPDLASEWDYKINKPLKPEDVTYGGKKLVWWLCKKKDIVMNLSLIQELLEVTDALIAQEKEVSLKTYLNNLQILSDVNMGYKQK